MEVPSSLSILCKSVLDFVSTGLKDLDDNVEVVMGAPAEALKGDKNRVNLFFHRFEPSGFQSDLQPDEPWWIRLHCLVTAFGVTESNVNGDGVSAGEFELRLIGHVMRLFHETPVLETVNVNGESVRLQTIYHPLTNEDLNHVWATQSEVSLRPTIGYEMALGPIVPSKRSPGKQMTGDFRTVVTPGVGGEGGVASAPGSITWGARGGEVDTARLDWAPHLCFVLGEETQPRCVESLGFEADSDALKNFTPNIWVAGDIAETVSLRWEVWDPASGWRSKGASKDVQPVTTGIDPDNPPDVGDLAAFVLPFDPEGGPVDDPPEFSPKVRGQAAVYAERQYTRPSDGAVLTVRSQPLLISIHEAAS